MVRFIENETCFKDLFTVTKKIIVDDRGYIERLFCPNDLKCWKNRPIKQVNRTFTKAKGTIRGLHFQEKPYLEAKFIYCLKGKVMDVALDLRTDSKTFGQVFSLILSEKDHNSVLIPEGFAHGFQTLSENVEMLYFHSNYYSSTHEAGINAFDPLLKISWQLPCSNISGRDRKFMNLQNFKRIRL